MDGQSSSPFGDQHTQHSQGGASRRLPTGNRLTSLVIVAAHLLARF
jgi:hypothetical protein